MRQVEWDIRPDTAALHEDDKTKCCTREISAMSFRRNMTLMIFAFAVAGLNATANADPVAERRALMKKTVLPNTKLSGAMVKGEIDFDAAIAEAAARAIAAVPKKFVTLFPEDSAGDPDSAAKDIIWTDMKGFLAAADKLSASATAAAAAAKSGPQAFKGAFIKMTQACKGCHEIYRLKKEQ